MAVSFEQKDANNLEMYAAADPTMWSAVLAFLPPHEVARLSRVCRALRTCLYDYYYSVNVDLKSDNFAILCQTDWWEGWVSRSAPVIETLILREVSSTRLDHFLVYLCALGLTHLRECILQITLVVDEIEGAVQLDACRLRHLDVSRCVFAGEEGAVHLIVNAPSLCTMIIDCYKFRCIQHSLLREPARLLHRLPFTVQSRIIVVGQGMKGWVELVNELPVGKYEDCSAWKSRMGLNNICLPLCVSLIISKSIHLDRYKRLSLVNKKWESFKANLPDDLVRVVTVHNDLFHSVNHSQMAWRHIATWKDLNDLPPGVNILPIPYQQCNTDNNVAATCMWSPGSRCTQELRRLKETNLGIDCSGSSCLWKLDYLAKYEIEWDSSSCVVTLMTDNRRFPRAWISWRSVMEKLNVKYLHLKHSINSIEQLLRTYLLFHSLWSETNQTVILTCYGTTYFPAPWRGALEELLTGQYTDETLKATMIELGVSEETIVEYMSCSDYHQKAALLEYLIHNLRHHCRYSFRTLGSVSSYELTWIGQWYNHLRSLLTAVELPFQPLADSPYAVGFVPTSRWYLRQITEQNSALLRKWNIRKIFIPLNPTAYSASIEHLLQTFCFGTSRNAVSLRFHREWQKQIRYPLIWGHQPFESIAEEKSRQREETVGGCQSHIPSPARVSSLFPSC